jgi:hypothetical protein
VFTVDLPLNAIQQVTVDPQWQTADGVRENNTYKVP